MRPGARWARRPAAATPASRGPGGSEIESLRPAPRPRRRRREARARIPATLGWLGWLGRGSDQPEAGDPNASPRKFDGMSKILNKVVTATSIPYVTYVPEPVSALHRVDARVKQVLTVACLVVAARGTIGVRLALCLGIGVASLTCLPKSYSVDQLLGVLKLCLVVGIFTLLAADAVTVPIQDRIPADPALLGSALFEDATSYKYTLLNFGLIKVTRRSVNLAAAACALQFATIQSTVICLTTTSPEALTKAYTGSFLRPLKWARLVNLSEVGLSVLLSFRFLGLIFEELQNVAKGMLARNIQWRDLQLVARIDIGTTLVSKAVTNLLSISDQIARSMVVRGYKVETFVHPHLSDIRSQEKDQQQRKSTST